MITNRKLAGMQVTFWIWLLMLVLAGFPVAGQGQQGAVWEGSAKGAVLVGYAAPAAALGGYAATDAAPVAGAGGYAAMDAAPVAGERTFPALLVSDIHFDPFHDPGKVRQLAEAPVSKWSSILSAADSPDQAEAFAKLQQSCHARGVDTPYMLLHSSLEAMWQWEKDAKFMTVSGDLIVHNFSCRYETLLPEAKAGEYEAFVVKTVSFVMGELRGRFPGMAVYAALGNNDSSCGDYRLDAGSEFLAGAAGIVAEGMAPASSAGQRQEVMKEFARGGYYSVMLGAPLRKTRLIVIDDVFLSPRYSTCGGKADPAAGGEEMAWLEKELAEARRRREKVWVMGHIPPGVDPYATVARFTNVCGGAAPTMFLSSEKLADLLIEHGDIIRLAIFGHTHMDEMRLLEGRGSLQSRSGKSVENGGVKNSSGVAVKLVASISPVNGNNPSFTVARVGESSAMLRDYEVIAASNQSGVGTTWSREYDYAQSYHESQFDPSAVKKLIAQFEGDREAKTEASREYIRHYYVGDQTAELKPFWPLYVCSLENYTAKAFAACACPAGR